MIKRFILGLFWVFSLVESFLFAKEGAHPSIEQGDHLLVLQSLVRTLDISRGAVKRLGYY